MYTKSEVTTEIKSKAVAVSSLEGRKHCSEGKATASMFRSLGPCTSIICLRISGVDIQHLMLRPRENIRPPTLAAAYSGNVIFVEKKGYHTSKQL